MNAGRNVSGGLMRGGRLSAPCPAIRTRHLGGQILPPLKLGEIQLRLDTVVLETNVKTRLLSEMAESVHVVSRVQRTLVLVSDDQSIATEQKKIVDARERYDRAAAALEKMPANEKGLAIRTKIAAFRDEARQHNDKIISLAQSHQDGEAVQLLLQRAAPATAKWQEAIDENLALQEVQANAAHDAAKEAYRATLLVLGLVAVLVSSTSLGIAIYISRSIVGPMSEAVTVARAVASGDLTTRIEVNSNDETGDLMKALRDMNDGLATIVGEVRIGTEAIAAASGQVASGNQDLSSRTEAQAGSLEETASSMEELTSTVKQNADNARQANQLAISASEVATKGGAVVSQVVETMNSISDSARKIADIISVIDGIAFQTNILPLNAAVEAARAGEQGRGFAVVASEVRTLAQRSANAAKEIKALISDSVAKVADGNRLVGDAGATMHDILESVKHVTDIMGEITAASQEQTSGIEQINQAINQMDEATQQNAALVEQAAAAASSMEHQAANLTALVSRFKVSVVGAVAAPVEPARSKPRFAITHRPTIKPHTEPSSLAPAHKAPQGHRKSDVRATGSDWEEF